MSHLGTGLGDLAGRPRNQAGFTPYVYGATLGTPSRGRPENVLANPSLPETVTARLARELATDPDRRNRFPPECGSEGGASRHRRLREPLCPACAGAVNEAVNRRRAARRENGAAVISLFSTLAGGAA